MKIQESAEDYLEAILILKNEKGLVHSIDVARQLDFSKPSVSRAVKLLREEGHFSLKAWLLVGQPHSSGWSHTQYLDNTNKFMGCFKKE